MTAIPTNTNIKKRILILMTEAGGGHRTAAEAIGDGLTHLYGEGVSIIIVDAWREHFAWPINRLPNSYSLVINEAVWLWKSFWLLEKKWLTRNIMLNSLYPLTAPGLFELFNSYKPDVIVSVHPLITSLSLMTLKQTKVDIPFITVVTDLVGGFHLWYHPQTTLCLVPTTVARKIALSLNIPPEKVEVVGQPVGLKFINGADNKKELRRLLGLKENLPVLLLAGGGEGYGRMYEIARCINRLTPEIQLVIVTGRNKLLKQRLEQSNWELYPTILGFVTNMPELMGAADIFITKAGPGSISEAFVIGLPLIIFGYIPGQEKSNVDYVIEKQAGVYLPDPEKIAALVLKWLQSGQNSLIEMAQNGARLARPEAVLTIARRIYEQAVGTGKND